MTDLATRQSLEGFFLQSPLVEVTPSGGATMTVPSNLAEVSSVVNFHAPVSKLTSNFNAASSAVGLDNLLASDELSINLGPMTPEPVVKHQPRHDFN